MEHECELASTKEKLGNVEVNQNKKFVGIEEGVGKNDDNVLLIMHKGKMSCEKKQTRQNYCTKCVLIWDKEYESSIVLSREEMFQWVKDV